jgi:uncharacterized protein DUF6152
MSKGIAASAAAIAAFGWLGALQAHHGNTYFFDTSKVITLEGKILSVEWVNPHRLLVIESTNEEGAPETWVLWGSANFTGPDAVELREKLQPGIVIVVRAFPSRSSNRREDTRPMRYPSGGFEVGAGEIRLPNGDVEKFGSGPTF